MLTFKFLLMRACLARGHAARTSTISSGEDDRSISKYARMVSLMTLALGVPCTPYATINAIVRQRPPVLIPVQAKASDSSARILTSEIALA